MITLPASLSLKTSMPFGLGLMNTAWSESELIKYASAIEDLQFKSGTKLGRTLPTWAGYTKKNIPVFNL